MTNVFVDSWCEFDFKADMNNNKKKKILAFL